MKRISRRNFLKAAGVGAAALSLAACGGAASSTASSTASSAAASSAVAADVTIKVAAIETGYGAEMWKKVTEAFTAQTGIKVDLTTDKKLEDVIGPSMQGGDYPDVVHLATGREAALTEQFIKGNLIADITDVLSMTVPGESKKVSEKIAGGFTDTSLTNPYGDGKTYLAPMFYSPCGLFYNAGFLKEKGWDVPTTWDEMWALGDKAAAEGTYLFTYPTTGYFDAFFYALMYAAGGPDFFNKATHYEEGIWDTPEAKTCFDIVAKLASYTNPITPAQANDQDFTQNQQLVLDNKALFMPNGTWIVGEMAEAPRADGFEWGMTALPAVKADICDYDTIREVFCKYDIDGVIHLAAESHVDRSIKDPFIFARTNVMGTLSLLQAAKEQWNGNWEGKRFYHISTDEVYGALQFDGTLFTEETRYDPHSPYSAAKASSDHFVRAYHDTYGLPTIVTNCSNNYGPYQFPEKLIPLFINNIRHGRPLPVYGKGENVRDWLYVEDHARAIDLIFHKGRIAETYNIGGFNEWKNIDLIKVIVRTVDRLLGNPEGESEKLITYVTDRAGHDLRYAIDSRKLKNELGWEPSLQFEEGIEKTVRWYLDNQEWMDHITSGEYEKYYESMYKNR